MLSLIFFISYTFGVLPMNFMVEKYGKRNIFIFCTFCVAAGSVLKNIACRPHLFWLTFIGQTLVSFSTTYYYGSPVHIAASYFRENEINKVVAILVFGMSFGNAMGFVITPNVVAGVDNEANIAFRLEVFMLVQTLISIALFLLVLLFFYDNPLKQKNVATNQREFSFLFTLKSLFNNRNYVLLVISAGCVMGVFYSQLINLNQMVLSKYPKSGQTVGTIGMLLMFSGCLSLPFLGYITDKFKSPKTLYKVCNVLALCATTCYTLSYTFKTVGLLYLTTTIMGFFLSSNSYLSLCVAYDITHPLSQSLISGIVVASNQLFGVLFSFIGTKLIISHGAIICNSVFVFIIVFVIIIDCFIHDNKCESGLELEATSLLEESKKVIDVSALLKFHQLDEERQHRFLDRSNLTI
ncbi:feline leukemia virus subgroup C receptor-related protein 2-like protein [Dinothrombium tinctorium]|uniref:Feline leukemia virus subgroup C receptor-related protein 2-like protein n=1 Tax=Dinothrombium tinctorium TaxID=1965070 RepID=A0A3S3Q384_9ACAR|nr:feline leukemia virus subgroup C receptor-related protein 2-like protein [Dinothrombium tinctorium]RWS13111.1 feline leukemia virus subgroup C receptor-related protein 2-like protein [Dinothrombium tinctorium]RWS13115.1 feline leukemia virus subgroup C receptor-related protein 2-like protein [Dinothrombium tinctorium]RWS13532.1 feline leukemia virus subgroup C receptor-related protein 2-like protein [Dinothrombium tinctorium]